MLYHGPADREVPATVNDVETDVGEGGTAFAPCTGRVSSECSEGMFVSIPLIY